MGRKPQIVISDSEEEKDGQTVKAVVAKAVGKSGTYALVRWAQDDSGKEYEEGEEEGDVGAVGRP